MEDAAIREGFANLHPGADYDTLYSAAFCRARADWTVGINATRLFSVLYGATLNVGRVQSPTLAMIVSREAAIRDFVTEPFYTPLIITGSFTAAGEKLKSPDDAESIRVACDGGSAVVLSVEKKKKTEAPPKLYDLTSLQRDANRLLGYTAQRTPTTLAALVAKFHDLGLIGPDSVEKRKALCKRLELPEHLSANALVDVLNLLMSREELEKLFQ